MANLIYPELRSLWEAFEIKQSTVLIQNRIDQFRNICEQFQPFPPLIKLLLNIYHEFPIWPVCPPLEELSPENIDRLTTMVNLA